MEVGSALGGCARAPWSMSAQKRRVHAALRVQLAAMRRVRAVVTPRAVCPRRLAASSKSMGALRRGRTRTLALLRSPSLVTLPRMRAAPRPPVRQAVPPVVSGAAAWLPRALEGPGTPWTSTGLMRLGLQLGSLR